MIDQDKLMELLLEGYSVSAACRELRIPYNKGYTIARQMGWTKKLRDKRVSRNPNYGLHLKMTLSEEEVVRRYENGERQTAIAKDANVSREYIRQIVKRNGCEGYHAKLERLRRENTRFVPLLRFLKAFYKRRKHEATLNRSYKRDFERWKEARRLWAKDVWIEEIAKRLNIEEGSLNWYIGKMRERYGWFPNREPFGHHRLVKLTEEEKKQRVYDTYAPIVPYYEQGLAQSEIAEKLGKSKPFVA